jgi:hypothetical protein
MFGKSILALAVVLGAAALVPTSASAKSGGHGMGNHGGMNVSRQQTRVERPTFKFKLIRCHKYSRGNGQGGVNWVSVCS